MSDNVELDPGTGGAIVAADDIAGVLFPRSKIIIGADGTNDGDVSAANPLPVKGTGTAGTANAGVLTVQGIGSMTPILATLSGTNNIATVTTVTTVGAVTAISNALPAGTNNIGDVDVLTIAAGDNNIGNVDIVTVPADPFGANADAASATGSISAKLRFIAATGIPITGTVTVGSHAVTNAGTFAVQATIAAGATNIAKAEDVASADADVGVPAMAVRKATPANVSGTDGDYEFLQMSAGRLWTSTTVDAALPAGTNNIGDVDVLTVPADPFGVNADAASATGSISAKLRFIATTGIPITGTVTVGSHAVTNAGTFAVQASCTNAGTFATQVDGSALTALQKIDDPVLVDDAAFTPATSSVMMAGFQADEGSTDSVDEGDAGAARMTLDRKVITQPQPHTAGGLSVFYSLDLDETEEDVKTSAGTLYQVNVTNRTTSVRYLKLYNATAANTTVGSTGPLLTIPIPANATDYQAIVRNFGLYGLAFGTALCAAVTTGFADNDTGAPGANDVIADFLYK